MLQRAGEPRECCSKEIFTHYEFDCCRKVVKKNEMHITEHTGRSLDAAVSMLHHSCIVDIDASYVISGTVYLVLTYCEVLSYVYCLLFYSHVSSNLSVM